MSSSVDNGIGKISSMVDRLHHMGGLRSQLNRSGKSPMPALATLHP
jgi:hypothetical protein